MDEDQYRATYKELNPNRCIFEKAITNRRCNCKQKRKFMLATRECIACMSESKAKRCTEVVDTLRNNARFSLKVVTINGPMPHNKELQVQAGGMLALQTLVDDMAQASQETVIDIDDTLDKAFKQYETLKQFPYGEIVKGIVKYVSRPKRSKR